MKPVSINTHHVDLSASSCGVHEVFSRECVMNMERGLHARPIVMLMKLAKHFVRSEDGERVEFHVSQHTVNPERGIIAMLGLAGGFGGRLGVTVRCAEAERAQELLNAVQAVVGHACPEDALYQPEAALKLGLKPELVDILRRSVNPLRPE
jgi:phosphotransferase system HPr-like phosphotransfer protein